MDQQAGSQEMQQLMKVTTRNALQRFRCDWSSSQDFGAEDVYAIQLLHCYDVVSGRRSPFETWFTPADWTGFEYLRDTKYHYSEGYGSDTWKIAVPWLVAVVHSLKSGPDHPSTFPLHVSFTHREEVLYLCCLLGIGYKEGWRPDLTRIDTGRSWSVSKLAPYLGHVGFEKYQIKSGEDRLRVVVNGRVTEAFLGRFEKDLDGGYDFHAIVSWATSLPQTWEGFEDTFWDRE